MADILDTERLAAFRAVADEQSFSRAAQRLFKTQPAISQAVRSLEEELGERLLHRLGRRSVPTPAGEALLEHVNQAFRELQRGRERVEAFQELRAGSLAIGTSDTTACYLLPPVLRAFRERYPGIELRISNQPSPRTAEQVARHEVDVGFVTLPIDHPRLHVEILVRREDVAICAPDHPLARRRRLRLADLLAYPLILLDRGSGTRSFIDEKLRACDRPPEIAMEVASIEVIKRWVELDLGVSIVPRIAVERELSDGSLHAMPVFPKREARQLGCVYPAGSPLPRAAQAFVQMALELLRDAPSRQG